MSDGNSRLIRCFAAVFPTLTLEEIPRASVDSAGVWDSLATVTLASVIEDEFKVEIDLSDLPELTSFEAFQDYLRRPNLKGINQR
jgi:acyl carrier protein